MDVMSLLLLLRALFLPLVLGVSLCRLLGIEFRCDRLRFLAMSWLSGSVVIAAILQVSVSLQCVPTSGVFDAVVCGLAIVGSSIASRRSASSIPPLSVQEERRFSRLLLGASIAFVSLSIVDHGLSATRDTISYSDEAMIYRSHAAALLEAGGYNARFAEIVSDRSVARHPDYPPLNALLQLWTCLPVGKVLYVEPRFPAHLTLLALALLLASVLRRHCGSVLGALLLVAVMTAKEVRIAATLGNADGMVAFGALALLDSGERWVRERTRSDFALSALSCAYLLLAKNEGSLLTIACAAGLLWTWRSTTATPGGSLLSLRTVAWLAIPGGVAIVHRLTNARLDLANDLMTGFEGRGVFERIPIQFMEYLPKIAAAFSEQMLLDPYATRFIYLALLVYCILLPVRMLMKNETPFALVFVLALVGYGFVYIGTPMPIEWHLTTSLGRVTSQVMPIAAVALGAAVRTILMNTKGRGIDGRVGDA